MVSLLEKKSVTPKNKHNREFYQFVKIFFFTFGLSHGVGGKNKNKKFKFYFYFCFNFSKNAVGGFVNRKIKRNSGLTSRNLSSVLTKPAFCICENKGADQLHSNLLIFIFYLYDIYRGIHNELQ